MLVPKKESVAEAVAFDVATSKSRAKSHHVNQASHIASDDLPVLSISSVSVSGK